jgi:tRNA modification GTPase
MNLEQLDLSDTICAIATPAGMGGIAVIRISGVKSYAVVDSIFHSRRIKLEDADANSIHFGIIKSEDQIIDEVLVSKFKGPNSFTGEDTIEIACHGAIYIQQSILKLLQQHGCRLAMPGEFTMRAFSNGKIDLSQAEAVADLIAAESAASHKLAMHQMRGGVAQKLNELRSQLIEFTALLELELDFAEEDVAFADRNKFEALLNSICHEITQLLATFSFGNAIKNGIAVAIVGPPNAGKSTLLNMLLQEERAIVSNIPGTTRDTIEEKITIEGHLFRLIDTAGIRQTTDPIEKLGVARSQEKIHQSDIVMMMYDCTNYEIEELKAAIDSIPPDKHVLLLANKIDLTKSKLFAFEKVTMHLEISALDGKGILSLKEALIKIVNDHIGVATADVILTNQRHYDALQQALNTLALVKQQMDHNISADLLCIDLRAAIRLIGNITGTIDIDTDILGTIFSKFCIGK